MWTLICPYNVVRHVRRFPTILFASIARTGEWTVVMSSIYISFVEIEITQPTQFIWVFSILYIDLGVTWSTCLYLHIRGANPVPGPQWYDDPACTIFFPQWCNLQVPWPVQWGDLLH